MKKWFKKGIAFCTLPVVKYTLSDRMKRVIVIGSLYGKVRNKKDISDATIHRLNTVFMLIAEKERENALLAPVHMQSLIWGGEIVELVEKARQGDEASFASLLEKVPDCLRYGRLRTDLEQFVREYTTIKQPA